MNCWLWYFWKPYLPLKQHIHVYCGGTKLRAFSCPKLNVNIGEILSWDIWELTMSMEGPTCNTTLLLILGNTVEKQGDFFKVIWPKAVDAYQSKLYISNITDILFFCWMSSHYVINFQNISIDNDKMKPKLQTLSLYYEKKLIRYHKNV